MKLFFDKNNNNIYNKQNFRVMPPHEKNKSSIPLHISDRHIHQMEHNIDTIKKRVPSLFIDKNQKNY